jgi:glycosyltransferase involved in cell wall biosynthesis
MIVHALAPGRVGGLESVVRLLAGGQAARGRPVTAVLVLDPGAEDHPLIAALAAAGAAVEPVVVPPRAYRTEWRALAAVFRRAAPAVIHTHGYRADVIAGAVARRAGVPTVATVHGFTGGGRKNRFYEWLQVRAFRRMDAVVAVSRPLVDRLAAAGVPRDRIACIPNAWAPAGGALPRAEARRRLGVPPERFLLGWVGRLSREKGADVFVRALAELHDGDLHASVVGDGRERPALQALAEELGAGERITWHGTLPDAGRLFTAFDALVLSSRTEGTPMVMFEAMSAGVPVIATRVGGVPDVAADGAAALLVPPEDPRALAAAVAAVRADPQSTAARAAAAHRRLAEAYGLEPWLDCYDQLYARISRR